MNISKRIEDVTYPNPYWWSDSVNPFATISNGLANCTCYVYGECMKQFGFPIVSKVSDARSFHKHLVNGWYSVPYEEYKANIKIGDVLEWDTNNHVCIVSDVNDIWVSGSYYTGINGVAYKDGKYDTRDGIKTLKQLNDLMAEKYPFRFFHNIPLEEECKKCGGLPDYVLVAPNTIVPVARDNSKNQVYVGVQGLRVRTEPYLSAQVRGVCPNGYFNVEEIVIGDEHENGKEWYKVDGYFIANVSGLTYYKKEDIAPLDEMIALMKTMQNEYLRVCRERDDLNRKLDKIRGILDE